ncbi:MAG: hypothetical protein QXR81_07595 [Candidatus Nezhaarchaeales archaeon]
MEGRSPFEKVSLEDLKKAIDAWKGGLKRKMDRRRGTDVESTRLNAAEPQRGGGGGPNVGLCRGCEYCRSVDIDGKVDCDLYLFGGREKAYCRGYKAKGDKVRGREVEVEAEGG